MSLLSQFIGLQNSVAKITDFSFQPGKEEAQEAYDHAKEQDQTAGQVSSRPRDLATAARGMEIFAVAVNVAPNSSVQFKVQ